MDCETDTLASVTWGMEWYMVRDHIWKMAAARRGYLCIGCLEGRLGFTLIRNDFANVQINEVSPVNSERLNDRLTATTSLRVN